MFLPSTVPTSVSGRITNRQIHATANYNAKYDKTEHVKNDVATSLYELI